MNRKEEDTETIKQLFRESNPIRVGQTVRYMVTNAWDEEKNFPDAFLKKQYGWSKNTFTVTRRFPKKQGSSVGGRTFLIADSEGNELPRRFLPWELRVVHDSSEGEEEPEEKEDDVRVGQTDDSFIKKLDKL
jgi:hypothetical protein